MFGKFSSILIGVALVFSSRTSAANHPQMQFDVSPTQCVAATKGRTCYVSGSVKWKSRYPVNVCLYLSSQMRPITCWDRAKKGTSRLEIAMEKDVVVSLLTQSTQEELAREKIILNWIYESNNRRRRWRLF